MSVPLTVNGVVFNYPVDFDTNDWAIDATSWAQAVTSGMLQKAGGAFPLTADVNFGDSFGLLAKYLTSRSAPAATSGTVRLASADPGVVFRNAANTGNLALTTDASNNLLFNGSIVGSSNTLTNSHIFVGNAFNNPTDVAMSGDVNITNTGATTVQPSAITGSKIASGTITDTNINAAAAIALTKLAATTASSALVSNGSGFISPSATTSAQIGFLSTVTSDVQVQINGKLSLSGGTMSGAINMGSNKVTSLASGTAAKDAATFDQIFYGFQSPVMTTSTTTTTVTSAAFTATALAASITPTSATHRIKVTISGTFTVGTSNRGVLTIIRNGIDLGAAGNQGILQTNLSGTVPVSTTHVDGPASVLSTTYTVAIREVSGNTVVWNTFNTQAEMILEEIV